MAQTNIWTGAAPAVQQVTTYAPTNPQTDDIYYITVTGIDGVSSAQIQFIVGSTETVAAVTAGLTAAWNASVDPLITPITASDFTSYVRLVADEGGIAFVTNDSVFDGGGGGAAPVLTEDLVVANSGPYDWTNILNWSQGNYGSNAVEETLIIEDAKILYNLGGADVQATVSITIKRSQIGYNSAAPGIAPGYLLTNNALLYIDQNESSPVAPINISNASTACTATIYNTGTNSDRTQPAVRLKGAVAYTAATVHKGNVAIADEATGTAIDTATVTTLNIIESTADVIIGSGVTLTTLNKYDGKARIKCAATTVTNHKGEWATEGVGDITTLYNYAGTMIGNSTGSLKNVNGYGGTIDLTQSVVARCASNVKIDPQCTFKYNPSIISELYSFEFDGGAHLPIKGETIHINGKVATDFATIEYFNCGVGDWADSDATGTMYVSSPTRTFIDNLENNSALEDVGTTTICDATGGVTAITPLTIQPITTAKDMQYVATST